MASSVEFCITLIREGFRKAQKELPGEPVGTRCSFAWGHVCGLLMRQGAKWADLSDLIFELSGNAVGEGKTIEELMKAIGLSINEVLLTTPSTMMAVDPEEALEDMACRLVLETVKHGLVIVDRKRYDRLVNDNAALKDAVCRHARA